MCRFNQHRLVDCNPSSICMALHYHRARGCHGDLPVARLWDSLLRSSIGTPTCLISFLLGTLMSVSVTPTWKVPELVKVWWGKMEKQNKKTCSWFGLWRYEEGETERRGNHASLGCWLMCFKQHHIGVCFTALRGKGVPSHRSPSASPPNILHPSSYIVPPILSLIYF